ncbi:unnamed protein product [Urochloa humidicola]
MSSLLRPCPTSARPSARHAAAARGRRVRFRGGGSGGGLGGGGHRRRRARRSSLPGGQRSFRGSSLRPLVLDWPWRVRAEELADRPWRAQRSLLLGGRRGFAGHGPSPLKTYQITTQVGGLSSAPGAPSPQSSAPSAQARLHLGRRTARARSPSHRHLPPSGRVPATPSMRSIPVAVGGDCDVGRGRIATRVILAGIPRRT